MSTCPQRRAHRKIHLSHFKPIIRAYALGYLSVTGPKLFALLRVLTRKDTSIEAKARLLLHTLRASTQINRFPASCAIIVGGATLLPRIAGSILSSLRRTLNLNGTYGRPDLHTRSIRIVCTFLSALLAFTLLNHDDSWSRKRASSQGLSQSPESPESLDPPNQHHLPTQPPPRLAGKTIDFTLFTTTRALSVLVITLWTRTQSSRYHPTHTNPQFAKFLTQAVDPAIFSLSAALIMHAWFYHPHRLPRSYNHWIHQAANIDPRFLQALRLARSGVWQYGVNNSTTNHLLRGVAADLHLPESYGDPALTMPVKCELIHSGCGPSCELHALWRFWRAFLLGLKTYLPLQLALLLRLGVLRPLRPRTLLFSLSSAARSSAFLGTFISSFYYGVCLSRTRLGPLLFPPTNKYMAISPQTWDAGLCILVACLLCGSSILVEPAARRGEMALFVAPRALATLLPRVYDGRKRWREAVVFAGGVVVVLDAVLAGKGRRVRGAG
ncbi:hypothetical protein GJ744_003994 [Endocarpon pusillum]|uniref:Integral membrane protein n=1 Tax=Endocarpon pusillum TaxID=364733 RepID=A0A8H7A681_9EURO|nr:hypothetical protein GJ744_003994 [Endocarpon pusillum]